jgi:hypothetical protein
MSLRVPAHLVASAFAAGLTAALLTQGASAQDAPPAVAPAPAEQAAPASSSNRPGLFEAIGRWIDRSNENFRTHLRGAKARVDNIGDDAAASGREIGKQATDVGNTAVEATKGAVAATKSAVDAVVKLPGTRVVRGNERCNAAPNGAPDCLAAADALCRKHGFSSGKSLDFTSAEECPARVMLSGRESEAECRIVTFINRAMCQ